MPESPTISALRSLVAAWTPPSIARGGDGIASGVPALDAALGGGLPRGRLTELVGAGDLVLGSLLERTRAARQRVALVDAADGFAPRSHPADALRHLVWVRARSLPEALACADVLVRDGNYALLVLDLRGVSPRLLRQQPAGTWHRLRLAAERSPGAVLVQSATGFIPAVPWRLAVRGPTGLASLRQPRAERVAALEIAVERGHGAALEERSA